MRRIDIDKVTRSGIGYDNSGKGTESDLSGSTMSLESLSKPELTDTNRLSDAARFDHAEDMVSSIGREKRRLKKSVKALITEIAILALALTLVFTVFFGITIQHGNDMYPAIRDGDVILYYRIGDPVNTEACVYEAAGDICCGRVAATGGTVISATGDMQLTFDGIYSPVLHGSGIYERTYAAEGEPLPITIEEGHYFMLGDNRTEAEDSRVFGQISRKHIRGRIVTVLRRRQI